MPNVFEIVTQQIIEQLERGVAPWRKPWSSSMPRNLISKKPYRGLNVILLGTQGYGSPYWVTFNQAKALGAHVRKGEKSSLISFWRFDERAKQNPNTGELENKTSVLLRYYRVFNIEQCDGLAALHDDEYRPVNPLGDCERIVAEMQNAPRIEQDGHAYYRPSTDVIGIPSRSAFESGEAYYSTLFHELTHSTGHVARLNRFADTSTDHQFGSESYSKEELVAEMGAAMLAGLTGISPVTLNNSASYLQCWINRLKSDSRLILSAASQAQKAVDCITGNSSQQTEAR